MSVLITYQPKNTINWYVSANNNLSIKEYNKISKYKDLEIEIEKMRYLKPISVPEIAGALCMIKKSTNKHNEKILGSLSQYEIQKLLFVELLISLKEYNQCEDAKEAAKQNKMYSYGH